MRILDLDALQQQMNKGHEHRGKVKGALRRIVADHHSTSWMLFSPAPNEPDAILVLEIIHQSSISKPLPR